MEGINWQKGGRIHWTSDHIQEVKIRYYSDKNQRGGVSLDHGEENRWDQGKEKIDGENHPSVPSWC